MKLEGNPWHLVFLSDNGFGIGDNRPGISGGNGGKERTLFMGDAVMGMKSISHFLLSSVCYDVERIFSYIRFEIHLCHYYGLIRSLALIVKCKEVYPTNKPPIMILSCCCIEPIT